MIGSWIERVAGGLSAAIERTLPDSIRAAPASVRRRAVLCVLLPLAVSVVTVVALVLQVLLNRPPLGIKLTALGVVVSLACSQLVRVFGSVRVAGHAFSLIGFAFMSTSAVVGGGLASPRAFSLMLIPMMASLLLGWRSAMFWVAAVTLELVSLIAFTYVGPDLSPGMDPATLRLFGLGAIVILMFSMLVIVSYDHANAMVSKELSQALEKAAAVNELKSALVANVSHELRTPLNGVLGSADLLMRSGLDEAQRIHAETIETASEALLRLIDDLLDMSRLEAGGMELDEVPIELRHVLGQTVEALAPLAEARRGARMVLHVEPDVPDEVIADPFRLRQIFTNLLSNAIKFTDDGHVILRVEMVGGAYRFCVSDTGVGIPEEDHERLFAAFEQARPSTAQFHGGSGLGLNIARRLVHLMGGEIAVRSAVGSGTTFCFDLPLREAPEDDTPRVKTGRLQVAVDLRDARERAAVQASLRWLGHEQVRSASEADIVIHDAAQPLGEWSVRIVMPSEIGRRTRREVRLARPFSPDRLGAALHRAVNEVSSSRPPTSSIAGKGRVLVADDNLVNRRVVHGQLSHLGFDPIVVPSGTAALEAITGAGTPFLGVFLDLRMPGMSGFETAEAIRRWEKDEGVSTTPLWALTAHEDGAERRRATASGFDRFLVKPLRIADLEALLEEHAAVPPGGAVEEVPAGTLDEGVWAELAALADGDPAFLTELIDGFVSSSNERLAQLRAGGDTRALAHAMKGAAMQMSAVLLADRCKALELAPERRGVLLDEIELELRRASAALRDRISRP